MKLGAGGGMVYNKSMKQDIFFKTSGTVRTLPTQRSGFAKIGNSEIILADGLRFLSQMERESIHAVVTDPPYGVKEYDVDQLEKRKSGKGGVWRLPPSFDGHVRAPLPRFTALDGRERERIYSFFREWAAELLPILKPGAHVFIATNSFIAPLLYKALEDGGLEFRDQIIRLVRTLRGGDRPKNAELEFPDASSLPRGCYEPWGLFRKPIPKGMTVGQCLRTYRTGALKRNGSKPFEDVIQSERTSIKEKRIADHPSLKPQAFLRKIVSASLPLGTGKVLDPFMGSGSTIAAAEHLGLKSVGIEINPEYFNMAIGAIPRLSKLNP
jgi:site-specific DNA-methyltransferase (adenine-specific)